MIYSSHSFKFVLYFLSKHYEYAAMLRICGNTLVFTLPTWYTSFFNSSDCYLQAHYINTYLLFFATRKGRKKAKLKHVEITCKTNRKPSGNCEGSNSNAQSSSSRQS